MFLLVLGRWEAPQLAEFAPPGSAAEFRPRLIGVDIAFYALLPFFLRTTGHVLLGSRAIQIITQNDMEKFPFGQRRKMWAWGT